MAEEMDKQEQATPYKLNEAKKKGQVGRSLEFVGLFSLLAMLATFAAMSSNITTSVVQHTQDLMFNGALMSSDMTQVLHRVGWYFRDLAYAIMPIWIAGLLAAIVASIVHTGPVFSTHPLKPDFSKLNPVKGFKKIFSRRALVELAKLVVKLALFVGLIYGVWKTIAQDVLFVGQMGLRSQQIAWESTTWSIVKICVVVFVLSALFDLWYSKRDFARQMRMSKRDIKDEHKRREGDPEIKAKRRKNQQELGKKLKSISKVKEADVVITNPTHYSVALKYRAATMNLPVVVSFGTGFIAHQIKRTARKNNVPIMSRPPLARYLYKKGGVGLPIPLEKQNQVAEVYRWILTLPNNKVMSI